jgi:AcrR family transcriptional regulator
MARKVDELERVARQNEILDCAQRMVYSIGYEDMSIQTIINELGISKGAFYHYFDSKPALLEALLHRTSQQGLQVIGPIASDPSIPPLEKLELIIQKGMQWKAGQKQYLMAILKAWYSDENALVRQKQMVEYTDLFGGLLKEVLLQGIAEDVFHISYPEMTGRIIFSLMTQMSDSLGHMLLKANTDPPVNTSESLRLMGEVIRAYTDAIEKVLGASPGSIHLIDNTMLVEWLPEM